MIKNINELSLRYVGAQYFGVIGRISRAVYWKFAFVNILAAAVVGIILAIVIPAETLFAVIFGLPSLVALAFMLVGGLSQLIRRFHDFGLSGWWLLLFFVLIGILRPLTEKGIDLAIWLEWVIWLLPGIIPGTSEENKFGSLVQEGALASGGGDMKKGVASTSDASRRAIPAAQPRVSRIIQDSPLVAARPSPADDRQGRVEPLSNAELNRIYAVVAKEVADGKFEQGLFARANVECDGEKERVERLYVKLRVEQYSEILRNQRTQVGGSQ